MKILRQRLEALLATTTARAGIVIVNQTTRESLEINPEMVFPSASMIKVLIMYEMMRQVANNTRSLDELLIVPPEACVGGAGILHELRPHITMSIRELVTLMIILSDNTATNLLIDQLGMERINQTALDIGLTKTVLKRHMMDFAAAQAGQENETSAADLARLFDMIDRNSQLPPYYNTLMLDILKRQQVRDKLPFYWPEEIILANKTGTLPNIEHDGGLLFLPNGTYIICILTSHLTTNYEGLQLVAHIGKIIYERFS